MCSTEMSFPHIGLNSHMPTWVVHLEVPHTQLDNLLSAILMKKNVPLGVQHTIQVNWAVTLKGTTLYLIHP